MSKLKKNKLASSSDLQMVALDWRLPLQGSFKISLTAQEKGKTLPLILCSLPMSKSVYYKNKKEIHI